MPRTSFAPSKSRKSPRKSMKIVKSAITSPVFNTAVIDPDSPPIPKEERPRARRSMLSRASVVAGDVVDDSVREVAVDGIGRGT